MLAIFLLKILTIYCIAHETASPVMLIHRYEYKGEQLDLVTIIMRESDRQLAPVRPISQDYIQFVIDALQERVMQTYEGRGILKRGDANHAALKAKEPMFDSRSAIVFICKRNDLSKILALVQVARDGKNPIPLLLRNPDVMLPEHESYEVHLGDRQTISSGRAELKKLIRDETYEYNVLELLFWHASQSGIFEYTFKTELHNGEYMPALPSYFAGATHKKGIDIFTKGPYSFQHLPEISNPDDFAANYLRMDLQTLHAISENMKSQPSAKTQIPVDQALLKMIDWDPLHGCARNLSKTEEKLPFYKEIPNHYTEY